jgi:hypothetical protein
MAIMLGFPAGGGGMNVDRLQPSETSLRPDKQRVDGLLFRSRVSPNTQKDPHEDLQRQAGRSEA